MSSKTRTERITDFIVDLPSNVRTAVESAWRGRERGLAIVAGVFLASLVITTVLAYGNGLSQTFLQTTLEGDVFDAKVEQQASPPVPGVPSENSTFTNDSALMVEVCEELSQRSEIADCSFVFGRQAIRTEGNFNNIEAFTAGYVAMESVTSENPVFENETLNDVKDIVEYKEPEAMNSGGNNCVVLGQGRINNFSGSSNSGNVYTDYKEAFTTTRLVNHNAVNRKNY